MRLLSVIFEKWRAERRQTPKTWLEFGRALDGFTETPRRSPVKSIHRGHIRTWKTAFLKAQSKEGRTAGR
jgi:hypothetical protein